MVIDPALLIPAFRSGRETPWAGDVLRHEYEKYTLGNMVGESYDFSVLPGLESTLPSGVPLSVYLNQFSLCNENLPFLVKWIDADKATSVHVHPYDTYLYIVKTQQNNSITCGIAKAFNPDGIEELLLSEQGDQLFANMTVCPGEIVHIPTGTAHALRGVTCYQIQPHKHESYRLYDWNRSNSRGQKRTLHIEKALSLLKNKQAERTKPQSSTLIDTASFKVDSLLSATAQPIVFEGSFAVLTCLQSAVIVLPSKRHLYLSKGQSLFIHQSDIPCTLTGEHCLLAVSKE